jgi:nucleotide-binding universal stress UspA family protein
MNITLRHLLVPTDFSDPSRVAVKYGVAFAENFGCTLHLLHVLETVTGADPLALEIPERSAIEIAIEAKAWDDLRRVLSPDEGARVRAELAIEWGMPVEEILRYAKEHEIDLIAMGTHGRGGIERLLLGSVAEHVVRHAWSPVLTVHRREHEFITR